MNPIGIFSIVFGVSYLTYSIIFRNKRTIYFLGIKIVKGKEDDYLKMQLHFAIFNSAMMIIMGSMIVILNLGSSYLPFILLIPLLFHLVNFIMKQISKAKGYVESK